jgi:TolB-like protein
VIRRILALAVIASFPLAMTGCASGRDKRSTFHDPNMDFGLIQSVAVMPFSDLSGTKNAESRVRDIFMTMLQATGAVYVVPPGEVARAVSRVTPSDPTTPSPDEVIAITKNTGADVVITGTVLEYGEVRSGSAASNVVSVTVRMIEGQTGRVIWSAAATRGGVGTSERLFGGGGEPMNVVTTQAVDDLLDRLFELAP